MKLRVFSMYFIFMHLFSQTAIPPVIMNALEKKAFMKVRNQRLSSISLNLSALCMFLNGIAKFLSISQRFPVLNAPVQVGLVGLW